MGLGLFGGGVAAARWFAARGANVTVTDLRDADIRFRDLYTVQSSLEEIFVNLVRERR